MVMAGGSKVIYIFFKWCQISEDDNLQSAVSHPAASER